jgi:glycosyltransferase involved in cell wall biosynthesis
MENKPLVSILMNCYNCEKYLKEAIDSIYAQTYENWEIIFVDNCSIDKSAEIAKSYDDGRLKYYKTEKNIPLYAARNFGFQYVTGEYLGFLDTDDTWENDKLELQIKEFSTDRVGLVYSNYWFLNESKQEKSVRYKSKLPSGNILDALLQDYQVGLLTILISTKELFKLNEVFDPNYQIIGDLDLVIRLASVTQIKALQKPLATYRSHGGNLSITESAKIIDELVNWQNKVLLDKTISSNPNFKYINYKINYLTIKDLILKGSKVKAFIRLLKYPISYEMLKLFMAIIVPNFILKLYIK